MNAGRHYIGYELNKEYYEYSIQRIESHVITVRNRLRQRSLDELDMPYSIEEEGEVDDDS